MIVGAVKKQTGTGLADLHGTAPRLQRFLDRAGDDIGDLFRDAPEVRPEHFVPAYGILFIMRVA